VAYIVTLFYCFGHAKQTEYYYYKIRGGEERKGREQGEEREGRTREDREG
jgi:hypothetical protein